MLTYDEFWEKLSPFYPVSKGTIRLPIAAEKLSIPELNHDQLILDLKEILEDLLEKHGDQDSARARASAAGEEHINPFITGELTGVVRFDCIVDKNTKQVKVVEVNCDYPDGLLLHDKTYSVLSKSHSNKHQSLFLELFSGDDIHVLHDKDAFFLDAYQTEADVLSKYYRTNIGGTVEEPFKYSTIRRCIEVSKISSSDLNKFSNRNRFVNTFDLRTLGYKDLLSSLEHELVPTTKSLSSETVDFVKTKKDLWVAKPTNGCEGENIYFGKDLSQGEWEALVDSLQDKDYVAQELIDAMKVGVQMYEDGDIVEKELYFDLCPHFFIKEGKVIGAGHTVTRFSENKVLNVSQGGGIGYYDA